MTKRERKLEDLNVIKSSVKLVRNFESYPFVDKLDFNKKFSFENDLISFIKKKKKSVEVEEGKHNVVKIGDIKIIINDNDHLNFISSENGLEFKTLKQIKELEEKISGFNEYAVSSKYGYLSPILQNCGLGIQVSSLIHLPGISLSNSFESFRDRLNIRGYILEHWEKHKNNGYFYRISSKLNLGVSEEELIRSFKSGVQEILKEEKESLKNFYEHTKKNLDDLVYRSFGILQYAREISEEECLFHLSNIRIGMQLDFDLPCSLESVNKIQSEIIGSKFKSSDGNVKSGVLRADFIRSNLKEDVS